MRPRGSVVAGLAARWLSRRAKASVYLGPRTTHRSFCSRVCRISRRLYSIYFFSLFHHRLDCAPLRVVTRQPESTFLPRDDHSFHTLANSYGRRLWFGGASTSYFTKTWLLVYRHCCRIPSDSIMRIKTTHRVSQIFYDRTLLLL